ncbi:MAG: PAS domain-containing protein [Parvibaculum sp.]|nr:PAS domain-containing protein [Parvibaculum sp.]
MENVEDGRSAWVLPVMSWAAINKAKARLRGSVEDVPSHVDDIELRPLSRQLLAWWLEAQAGRTMPEPEDVDPKALIELLPYFRMMRWENEERLEFRIYGSALVEATGMDLTGMNCIAPFDYGGKDDDVARLKLIHAHPCGLLLQRDLMRPDGSSYTCEFMTLPVSGGADGRNRIVGTVVPCEEIDERRLDFSLKSPLIVRRAVFFDTGNGLPDAAKALSI